MVDPVEIVAGQGGLILLCDHASNAVPAGMDLGVAPQDMARHIAYDVGAREVTLGLAAALGAPAVLGTVSRLVIDPNRGEDDPTLVMRLYDGTIIPGNRDAGPDEIARRLAAYHRPYHAAVAAAVEAATAPVLLGIHSFTPQLRGRPPRPWQVGVLWAEDKRLAAPLIAALQAEGLCVGDNEPYHGALRGDTMWTHGLQRGIPHALIEIRNDLIADATGQADWAARLARILPPVLAGLDQAPSGDQTALEAAVYRRLRDHLRDRTDVQNIDLMNLAGFCRNCLSRWYEEASGGALDRAAARRLVYGMPYDDWRARYQTEARPEQAAAFAAKPPAH